MALVEPSTSFMLNTMPLLVLGKPMYLINLCAHWSVTVKEVTVIM